jgi:signal transduction histidine kinase
VTDLPTEPGTPACPEPADPSALSRAQLAVYAHELRGALTVIAGYTDILRRPLNDAERLASLDGIERAIRRADVLCSAALSGREIVPSSERLREPVSLCEIAEQIAEDQRGATKRAIRVAAATDGMVLGDAEALARVLTNVVSNAAKYSPPQQPIDISVTAMETALTGKAVVVEVADRGPGVPEDARERVLEPFERLARDEDLPGTGLGLAIVREVVEAHGGGVRVLEREGGGTVVRMELPRN